MGNFYHCRLSLIVGFSAVISYYKITVGDKRIEEVVKKTKYLTHQKGF